MHLLFSVKQFHLTGSFLRGRKRMFKGQLNREFESSLDRLGERIPLKMMPKSGNHPKDR